MKKIMILLAVMAMTTLMVQANETIDNVSNAIEKAVDAITPSNTTDESQAIEAAKQAAAEEKQKEEEKESEKK